MQSFLRLILFFASGILGVGFAVCLVINSEGFASSESSEKRSSLDALAGEYSIKSSEDFSSKESAWLPSDSSSPETKADYHPSIAQHFKSVNNKLREIEINELQRDSVIDRTISVLASLMNQRNTTSISDRSNVDQTSSASNFTHQQNLSQSLTSPDDTTIAHHTEIHPGEGDEDLVLELKGSDLREVLSLLSEQGELNIIASKSVQGQVTASLSNVNVISALDAILRPNGYVARREGNFIFVGTPEEFDLMGKSLDRVSTRVYRPNYITSHELQSLITPLLTNEVGTISINTAAENGIPSDSVSAGGDSFGGGEVLIVRDYLSVLSEIDQIIDEVDRRPLQVSIEAMILNVNLDDSNSFGVNFELLRDKNNTRIISGAPLADLANIDLSKNRGLTLGFLDSSFAVFLDALETVGETNVVAKPRLMCLNKQRAEIHIGSEFGYLTTTVTENAATESVEFLEVGTQLRIRPFISTDGMIRMEVHPELSSGEVDASGLPQKDLTQVTTNVMVADGRTVVIGGLIRDDLTSNGTQIPILGQLPILGPVFRQRTDNTNRNEIIVLITPRIIFEPHIGDQGKQIASEFDHHHRIYADKMSSLGRTYHSRRYYRLAQSSWLASDACSALEYANLSIHFDPMFRKATNLRQEILSSGMIDADSINTHLKVGIPPLIKQYHDRSGDPSVWMLEQYDQPPTESGARIVNPGHPASRFDTQSKHQIENIR